MATNDEDMPDAAPAAGQQDDDGAAADADFAAFEAQLIQDGKSEFWSPSPNKFEKQIAHNAAATITIYTGHVAVDSNGRMQEVMQVDHALGRAAANGGRGRTLKRQETVIV